MNLGNENIPYLFTQHTTKDSWSGEGSPPVFYPYLVVTLWVLRQTLEVCHFLSSRLVVTEGDVSGRGS